MKKQKWLIIPDPLKARMRIVYHRSRSLDTVLACANNHLKRKYLKNPLEVEWVGCMKRDGLELAAVKLEHVWKMSEETWNSIFLVQTSILFLGILWFGKLACRVFQNPMSSWFLFLLDETNGHLSGIFNKEKPRCKDLGLTLNATLPCGLNFC